MLVRIRTLLAAASIAASMAASAFGASIAFPCSPPPSPFYGLNPPGGLTAVQYPGISSTGMSASFSCPGFTAASVGTGIAIDLVQLELLFAYDLGGSLPTTLRGVFTPQIGANPVPITMDAIGTTSGYAFFSSPFLFTPATTGISSFPVLMDVQILSGGFQPCFIAGPAECGAITVDGRVIYGIRDTSTNPIQPIGGTAGNWLFIGGSGLWYDPPLTNGYDYTGLSGTTFTKITLPGCCGSVNVSYGPGFGTQLGTFAPNSVVDFASLTGGALGAFRIWGLNPELDAGDPNAFPLQIFFSDSTGSFSQVALDAGEVPEPGTLLSCAMGIAAIAGYRRRRQSAN